MIGAENYSELPAVGSLGQNIGIYSATSQPQGFVIRDIESGQGASNIVIRNEFGYQG